MTDQLVWTDANGNVTILERTGQIMFRNLEGFDGPPTQPVYQRSPFQHGRTITRMLLGPRECSFELAIVAPQTESNPWGYVETHKRALLKTFGPLSGQGTKNEGELLLNQSNGNSFRITGVPSLHFPGQAARGPTFQLGTVAIYCEDPFFKAANDIETLLPWVPEGLLFPVLFPLVGSLGATPVTVDPDSDVPVPVVMKVIGPADNLVFQNLTTGKSLSLPAYSLPGGYHLEIDTSFGHKTAKAINDVDGSEINIYGQVVGDMWDLAVGENDIIYEDDARDASVAVASLVYRPQYLGVA